jgi:predicted nuclease of predicted toxin-antitoxin system
MRLLLDEMYPPALSARLQRDGIEAATAVTLGVSGRPDADVFAEAVARGYTILTENVSDFARIAAEEVSAGRHHHGVLIALSSRFSRRPSGIPALAAAVQAVALEQLDDRVIYLRAPDTA